MGEKLSHCHLRPKTTGLISTKIQSTKRLFVKGINVYSKVPRLFVRTLFGNDDNGIILRMSNVAHGLLTFETRKILPNIKKCINKVDINALSKNSHSSH